MKYELDESIAFVGDMKQGHLNRLMLMCARIVLKNAYRVLDSDKDISYEIIMNKGYRFFIIKPKNLGGCAGPVNINIHGGAFVFRGWDNHFQMCSEYAKRTKSIVIYIDYRLAYCNKYHASLDDCISTYEWVINNKDKYDIDLNNIIISGDSAGGYLALELNDYIHKHGAYKAKGLMLIYPAVDPDMRSESMNRYTDTPVWNSIANKDMWNIYLKGNKEISYLDRDLSNIKDVYIEICEYDCLHDEGYALANKIKEYGNEVYFVDTKKTVHGYDTKLTPRLVREVLDKRIEYLNNVIKK